VKDTRVEDRLRAEGGAKLQEHGGPPGPASPALRRRIRRRRAATAIVALLAAVAVVAAGVVGIGAAFRSTPASTTKYAAPEGSRVTTLYGTLLRYPRDWTLLELPPQGNPAPLLQLTNFDPAHAASPGCHDQGTVPRGGVRLVIAQERGPLATEAAPHWPVPLPALGNGCLRTRWTVRGIVMDATAILGPKVGAADRRDLFDAFHSMRFPQALTPGVAPRAHRISAPGVVVTSGYLAGKPASWLAFPGPDGPCLTQVVEPREIQQECTPLALTGELRVAAAGPWAVVVGLAAPDVRSVEVRLAAGDVALGELVPAPRLLGASFRLFVVELPRQSRGDVVVRDERRRVLQEAPFDPPPLPILAHGGPLGSRWVLLDREQSNGVRCIDFDRGRGDQGSLCPTSVPKSRDVEATVFPLARGRRIVVGVMSPRVKTVWVMFLDARFVAGRVIPIPAVFLRGGSTLPPRYSVFTVPVDTTDSALVVAFDENDDIIDGLPLGSDVGFGD
jgi:hypothetical protein